MKKGISIAIYIFLALSVAMFFVGCDSGKQKNELLQAQVDSLSSVNKEQSKNIQEFGMFVSVLSSGLDSIKVYEDSLLHIRGNDESPKLTKEQLKNDLEELRNLIERQKRQLAQLRKQLEDAEGGFAEKMRKMVDYYETQLKEKDEQIAQLKLEISQKTFDLTQLKSHVNNLTASNSLLKKTTEAQSSVLTVQSDVINTGYIQIGTKKELKAKGLITGNFLSKKVDVSKLQEENFSKVDIRYFNDVILESRNPKILTQVPTSSYTIQKNGDGTFTLHISDPNKFWSISNYLIIQL